jgi:hypothetical protein
MGEVKSEKGEMRQRKEAGEKGKKGENKCKTPGRQKCALPSLLLRQRYRKESRPISIYLKQKYLVSFLMFLYQNKP